MKKITILILIIAALLVFPAVLQAKAPADVEIALDGIVFEDTVLQVVSTDKGLRITAPGLVGTATLRCVAGPCDFVTGQIVVITQVLRINIDHTSAGIIASGGARGTLGLAGLDNAAKFAGKVGGSRGELGDVFSVDLVEVCKMSSYINDRIRELNKFRLDLTGTIVREGVTYRLVNLTGTGAATGVSK